MDDSYSLKEHELKVFNEYGKRSFVPVFKSGITLPARIPVSVPLWWPVTAWISAVLWLPRMSWRCLTCSSLPPSPPTCMFIICTGRQTITIVRALLWCVVNVSATDRKHSLALRFNRFRKSRASCCLIQCSWHAKNWFTGRHLITQRSYRYYRCTQLTRYWHTYQAAKWLRWRTARWQKWLPDSWYQWLAFHPWIYMSTCIFYTR